jgi:hypothetical protein
VLVGLLRYKAGRNGVVKPEFRVDALREAGSLRLPSKDELLQRWAQTAARPKRDLTGALAGPSPRVVVITGVGSVAVDDVRVQLKELESDGTLEVVRVPIGRPAEVVKALRNAAADAVVLTRGGGEGVNVLDGEGLIDAVAASPVPVAVALGHATDDLVLGRFADPCFPTPTAFGAWLRSRLEQKHRHARDVAEAEAVSGSQELLGRLERTQAVVAWWRTAALVLAALWLGVLVWLLAGR